MIRPASVADMWSMRRKPRRRIFFYNDTLLASSYHPYLQACSSLLDPLTTHSDQVTLVLRDHGVRGYLQARRHPNTAELDLQFLTAYSRRNAPPLRDGEIFFRLIEDLLKRAGKHHLQRVFATVGARAADLTEVLRQLGFQPFTQQSIWMLPEPVVEVGSALVALRHQSRRDAWAIHQLYCSLTPRHVLQAELRDSTSWLLPRAQQWMRHRERGWVLGDDQSIVGHIGVKTGSRGYVLRMMIAEHLRSDTAAMVRYVLAQLHEQRPIFVVLRSYQSELSSVLEDLGFVERGEQTLFVKQLAIVQRQPSFLPTLRRNERSEGGLPTTAVAPAQREAEA